MRSGWLAFLILLSHGVLSSAGPPSKKEAPELPPLNASVLEYARDHLGKKVTNGQCTSLAVEALREARAKRFPMSGTEGDFVWGRRVESFNDALPGDVLQFRDVVFKGKRALSNYRTLTWREDYPHHTAIIVDVKEHGKVVKILHQNTGRDDKSDAEKMIVQEGTLRLDALQPGGKIWIYRPVSVGEPSTGHDSKAFP